tara:strand:+ start:17 stop:718 length:702 start_codon:yes stop_codon:yes gene_type:complete
LATVNIGNLTFTHKGDYASGTQYVKNDVVYYSTNGNAYIAKQTTTGNAPTDGTYWSQFAQGSGGIWNGGLALGSAGQQLRVNSGATALEFATIGSGGLLKTAFSEMTSQVTLTHTAWQSVSTAINFTPTSSSSKLTIMYGTTTYQNAGVGCAFRLNIAGSVHGTNQWSTANPISTYSGSGTAYHSPFFITQYNNTSTSAKNIVVEGIRLDSSTNAYANYNSRVAQMYIMETGV